MPKKCVSPRALFRGVEHGFSHVVVVSDARTVFVSGQTARDANRRIVGGICSEQARQALLNVKAAVEAAGGGTISAIVVLRIYVVHIAENVGGTGSRAETWRHDDGGR